MTKANTAVKAEEKVETKPKGPAMTSAQAKVVAGLPTVSARIRYLNEQKFSRSEITKLIPNASGNKLRYQHVRNVLEVKVQTPKTA